MKDRRDQWIYECLRPACRFRFVQTSDQSITYCPKCGSALRVKQIAASTAQQNLIMGNAPTTLELLLDNIRSAFNVGSILRSADGANVQHVHICGITPTPDHPRVAKTALGAEAAIPWTQYWNSLEAAQKLKQKGYALWGLECTSKAAALPDALRNLPSAPLLLIAGNELAGVDTDLIAQCDQVVHIPMLGVKESLNVAVAVSIAIYMIRFYPVES